MTYSRKEYERLKDKARREALGLAARRNPKKRRLQPRKPQKGGRRISRETRQPEALKPLR